VIIPVCLYSFIVRGILLSSLALCSTFLTFYRFGPNNPHLSTVLYFKTFKVFPTYFRSVQVTETHTEVIQKYSDISLKNYVFIQKRKLLLESLYVEK